MIPRQIFQTWKTKSISDEMRSTIVDTWTRLNSDFKYTLFDDNECIKFLQDNFDSHVVDTYNEIKPGALKADFWRYCVLYIHGGVYADIDMICLENLETVLGSHTFVSVIDLNTNPYEGKHNLFNAFIACVPGHPIMKGCIDRIQKQVLLNELPASRLDWAGPGVLGRETNIYLGRDETDSFIGLEGITDNGNMKLLHFSPENEFVSDGGVNILQNKNGNPALKKIYEAECARQKVRLWTEFPLPW